MLVGRCFIVCKLDVDEDKDPELEEDNVLKLEVTKMRRISNSVDIVIVGDEEVVFLEERSKSFAYGGANHQPWKKDGFIILIKAFSSNHSHQSILIKASEIFLR